AGDALIGERAGLAFLFAVFRALKIETQAEVHVLQGDERNHHATLSLPSRPRFTASRQPSPPASGLPSGASFCAIHTEPAHVTQWPALYSVSAFHTPMSIGTGRRQSFTTSPLRQTRYTPSSQTSQAMSSKPTPSAPSRPGAPSLPTT